MPVPPEAPLVGRRTAARAIAAAALAAVVAPRTLLAGPPVAARERPPTRLVLGIVPPRTVDAAWRAAANGMALGAEEAGRVAAMLGRELVVRDGSAQALGGDGADVLLGGASGPSRAGLVDAAARSGALWLDVACGASERRAPAAHVFHVVPGPESLRRAAARASSPGRIVVWHPSLERFGAAQLNARYVARFDEEMVAPAWAGWVAVKIAWESFLRAEGARGDALAAFLRSPRARFDGHKGRALRFDPATRELVQPLYVVRDAGGGASAVEEIAPLETSDADEPS